MKSINWLIALPLLAMAGSAAAWGDRGYWGDRGHVYFGVGVGPYWGGPWGYPAPYYYPPYSPYYYPPVAPLVVQQQAPVYVEQTAPAAAAPASAPQANFWYYCNAAKGYYPYVKECPGGWQRVSPQPPAQP